MKASSYIMADTKPVQCMDIGGIMWPTMVTKESLKKIKEFDVWADDVWIATYPKSGTHWVAEMCNLIKYNGHIDQLVDISAPIEFATPSHHRAKDLIGYSKVSEWEPPRVITTHVPVEYLPQKILDGEKGKVISVIRNPKDSLVSLFYFQKGVKPGAPETFSQCLEEQGFSEEAMYNTWFGHVLGYWARRHHTQFLVLKYEELKRDTRGAVIQIADFMGRPLSDEAIDEIAGSVGMYKMKARYETSKESRKGTFLRKGVVGDWKTHFTVAENEAYDALYRQKMVGSGLELQFE